MTRTRREPMRAFETMKPIPTDDDWGWAMDAASLLFDEAHEFPSQAHPRDREDWEEATAEQLLKQKGFDL